MKLLLRLGLLLVLGIATKPAAEAQVLKDIFGKNKINKNKEHVGRWKYKEDKENPEVITSKGRFKNGKQVKKWKYFYPNGQVYLVEKYDSKKDFRILNATYYHRNGKIAHTGQAVQENTAKRIHYYWIGDWKYYNEDGTLRKTVIYEAGWPVKAIYPDGHEEKESAERYQTGPQLQSL
ncbi:toxin-antitoxin system YwqK family antitoxin [Adhaeribacter radiodurans]|uniref:Toxin-antitoxin system YwqK family antitoxin n=1 Tax=Adhaeribacter radiodurans TaxID=2745197 RepID=A0A7L7L6T5_9BACT|nr:hypothetical protein [Adhaeribacter radiodurans]QMU28464.1 hypothetical protein HUW48_10625 [Adhaeribacter radiodurans]